MDKVDDYFYELLEKTEYKLINFSESKGDVAAAVADTDAIIVRSATKVNTEFLQKCQKLKLVCRAGVGLDNIDLKYCQEKGIKVVNSAEASSQSVAELTLGLILASARNIAQAHMGTIKGEWPKKASIGFELAGKTLGIIGTGAIGFLVTKFSLSLGMKVIGYDIIKNKKLQNVEGFEYCSLDTLFKKSDIITLHVPAVPSTINLISNQTINQMKNGVVLINTSRGQLINESELIEALNARKIRAVALDVFSVEPPVNQKLLNHPSVLATPHIGANTLEAQRKNASIIVEKIIEHFK